MISVNENIAVVINYVKAVVEEHGYTLEALEFHWQPEHPTWRMRTTRGGLTTSTTASSADELLEAFGAATQQRAPGGGPW